MKNKRSTVKIIGLLAVALVALPTYNAGPAMPMQGAPVPGMQGQMPPLTEAELLQWQQEVDKEINAFVSTLPATRAEAEALSAQTGEKVISQEEFHQEVAIMEEKMKSMAAYDEQNGTNQLGEFLGTIFPQEEMNMPQAPVQAPVIEQPTVEIPAAPTKEPEKTESTEKIYNTLNNIITRLERFLRKTPVIPEFAGAVATWAKQDKIKEWRNDLTWSTLKADMQAFNQILRHIKDSKDPKTQKPRYLSLIMKDESLLNNLNKVSNSLTIYEPKVDPSELGTTKAQQTATLNAAKDVLGVFTEALYTLDLPQELKKLIKTYEPQAEILRKEYDEAKKRAVEESKRPTPPQPRREASSIGYGASPAVGASGDSYGGGYNPYYGGGYSGYNPTALPDYNPNYDYAPYEAPSQGKGQGGAPAAGQQGAKGGPAQQGGKPGAPAQGEAKDGKEVAGIKPADKKPDEPFVEDPVIGKIVEKFTKSMQAVAAHIEDYADLLKDFDAHIKAKGKADLGFVTAVTSSRGIVKSLRKATDALAELKGKLLRADKRKRDVYFGKVKLELKDLVKPLEAVAKKLQEAAETKPTDIPANKLYAYVGVAEARDEAVKLDPALATLENPTNVTAELLKALGKYKDTLKGI